LLEFPLSFLTHKLVQYWNKKSKRKNNEMKKQVTEKNLLYNPKQFLPLRPEKIKKYKTKIYEYSSKRINNIEIICFKKYFKTESNV
jgi:hypothetical protein